jgi:hypothetical protein
MFNEVIWFLGMSSHSKTKEFVEKLGAIIVKLHRKRAEYKSQMEKQSVP